MLKLRVSTRKALLDVSRRKGRALLMILGIFIGVLSLTAINGANDLFSKDLHAAVSSSFDLFFSLDQAPAGLVSKMEQTANVAAVQPRTAYNTTWHLSGGGGTTSLQILGYPDLQNVQVGPLQLISGRLPGPGEIAMDTSATLYAPVALEDSVRVNTPGGEIVSLRVVGLIRSAGLADLASSAQGYMTLDAFQQVAPAAEVGTARSGPPVLQQQLLFKTSNPADNELTFDTLQSELAPFQVQTIASSYIPPQTTASAQMTLDGLSSIFIGLASLALLLTCLMILTTINNMLTEQFKVIGTMKAIGATRGKIMRGYLLTVGICALLGTIPGLALGLFLCTQVAKAVARQTKLDLGPFQPSPGVILVSLAVGLIVPLLAALLPLWIGTRITVRQAIASYGISAEGRRQRRSQSQRVSGIPQTIWLSLRGIFRKPGRAWLTILALTISAMTFMIAQTANTSLGASTSNFIESDFEVNLGAAPVSYQQISAEIAALPNVAVVEPLDHASVQIATHQARIIGLPADTHFYTIHLVAGRWLHEHEYNTLVISDIASERLHAQVGDSITLTKGSRQMHWRVVGIVHDLDNASGSANPQGRPGSLFTTMDNLNVNLRQVPADYALTLELRVHDHSQAALNQLHGSIQRILQQAHLWESGILYNASSGPDSGIILYALFDTVAITVALVGLLGLSNTLAAEVIERRREVGILRSLGARGRQIGMIFWIEGLFMALIAWIPGILLAIPGSYAVIGVFNASVGPLDMTFNPVVIPFTLLFILVVSFLASFGPALSASRVRIGEMLRYE